MELIRSIKATQTAIANGQITCAALVKECLTNIQLNEHLNAYLEVFGNEAQEKAAEIDQKIAAGNAGKLAGCIIALKDNICYQGHKLGASSKILAGFESQFSATVVERLLAEDAIIIGRTNCDEFAMGSSTENSAFGPTLNADDNNLVPGGSSGGSAVAVQAGLCHVALGSDTGGSIRQPAAFCNLVGLRPTYGHVSRWGLIAYASSFDQIGPLANNSHDAKLVMQIMSGFDSNEATSSTTVVNYNTPAEKPKKVAFIKNCIQHEAVDAEIKQRFEEKAAELEAQGIEVDWIDFPYVDYAVPNYYVLTTAEASSNLSRFAGMLYGHRSKESTDIASTIIKSRSEGFGDEVQRRIMLGTFVLSAGYYDAYYTKAQQVRRLISDYTFKLLKDYEYIMLPTAPHTAFKMGANADPIAMYLEDIFCIQASLAGIPAVSVPLKTHSNGLGIGMQIMSNKFTDHYLLDFAEQFERK
ncbi:MAG: Asp-tRNA(Asn)/Glu-tRNA(Gln) amidotransferase subunit GatA [Bacteroidetes bacterium]|nr:Asp-tRNA(Asn)/Glu-tRNA(Gln) amidotransferase subunit GatA [Bacteroidota bacterium]